MNNRDWHQARADFLAPWRPVWALEILQHYPASMNSYDAAWISALMELDDHEQWQFDAYRVMPNSLPTSLQTLTEQLTNFSHVPQLRPLVPVSDNRPGLTPKKAHEIQQLIEFLREHNWRRLIDIGGGVGHLSAILAAELKLDAICLEANPDFVRFGARNRQKLSGRAEITHRHAIVPNWEILSANPDALEIDQHWPKSTPSLGLHTCGPLALSHISMARRHHGPFLNLACCYYRLDPKRHTNLSSLGHLQWTPYALTLAARGHSGFPFDHFAMKKRVKFYRYALELYLQRELGHTGFTAIGESKLKKYRNDFGDYASEKIKLLLPESTVEQEQLNAFYQAPGLQQELEQMFAANLIRWSFGRTLEVHLLMDRLLYCQELGLQVTWGALFDPHISPRNIAILQLQ